MSYSNLPSMGLTVEETAARLAVYAYVLTRTTRLLGSWASDTPEIELKIMWGRHVHQDATAVRSLQDRVDALVHDRSLCACQPPGPWRRWLAALGGKRSSLQKLHGMHAVVKRELLHHVQQHIVETHRVWDAPTVLVLEQIARDLTEQAAAAAAAVQEIRVSFAPGMSAADVEASWQHVVDAAVDDRDPQLPYPDTPARDGRFTSAGDSPPLALRDSRAVIGALHRLLMSIEIPTIEVCGRMIAEFPEMPWDFVLDMSRQSWDESRHAVLCYERILQLGGHIGQFPIDTQMWQLSHGLPLPLRLAVHQRLGEWLGVDGTMSGMLQLRHVGDLVTARSLEYVIVDEIAHVAYGNKWIHHLVHGDEAVRDLHMQAVAQRASFGLTVNGAPDLPINVHMCELSGFTPDEIRWLQETRLARKEPSHSGASPD